MPGPLRLENFVVPLVANDDLAYVYRATPKVIKVRDNEHASTTATLGIVTPPHAPG